MQLQVFLVTLLTSTPALTTRGTRCLIIIPPSTSLHGGPKSPLISCECFPRSASLPRPDDVFIRVDVGFRQIIFPAFFSETKSFLVCPDIQNKYWCNLFVVRSCGRFTTTEVLCRPFACEKLAPTPVNVVALFGGCSGLSGGCQESSSEVCFVFFFVNSSLGIHHLGNLFGVCSQQKSSPQKKFKVPCQTAGITW